MSLIEEALAHGRKKKCLDEAEMRDTLDVIEGWLNEWAFLRWESVEGAERHARIIKLRNELAEKLGVAIGWSST